MGERERARDKGGREYRRKFQKERERDNESKGAERKRHMGQINYTEQKEREIKVMRGNYIGNVHICHIY